MAVVAMEGFDHLAAAQIGAKGWTASGTLGTTTGRFGTGQCFRNGNGASSKALPGSYTTLIWGGALNIGSAFADEFVWLKSGGTNVCRLTLVASGPNWVFRLINSAGTTLATGTTPVAFGVWVYVEFKVVVSATVGTVEMRLNGSSTAECSATGLNTGSLAIDNVAFGAGNQTVWHDDIYVCDTTGSSPTNTFLGDVRVETLFPNGNGANTAWTGVYTDYDDTTSHDTDSTYISSATPGDRETATLSDLSITTGTVFAVQANVVARKDDAGLRTVAPVLRIGGVNYDGTTTAGLSTSYVDYTQLYDRLDPSGAGWTVSTINAMEAGVKEVG